MPGLGQEQVTDGDRPTLIGERARVRVDLLGVAEPVGDQVVEDARRAVLDWFNARDEYTAIFTQNATAALKHVGESFPFGPGGHYLLTVDNHNSVNGIREFARGKGAVVDYVPLTIPDLRIDTAAMDAMLGTVRALPPSLLAFPAQSNFSGVRHPLDLIDTAYSDLGSPLGMRIREEKGLAYYVGAQQMLGLEPGMFFFYVGTRPEWADKAADVIRGEYRKLAETGLSNEELADMKGQVKGQIVLSLEGTSSRLHRLAGTALYDEPFLSIDEMMRRVDAVTGEDVAALAAEYFDPERQVVARLGPGA